MQITITIPDDKVEVLRAHARAGLRGSFPKIETPMLDDDGKAVKDKDKKTLYGVEVDDPDADAIALWLDDHVQAQIADASESAAVRISSDVASTDQQKKNALWDQYLAKEARKAAHAERVQRAKPKRVG